MAEKTDERVTDEKVVEIEMERLREFANHPFKVCADSQMIQLQDSIKKYGILNPLIVRPRPEGFYEIINSDNKLYGIGKSNKYHIPLQKLPITVGKMAGAVDLVLNNQSVSRLHARISRDGNRFFITDFNSTNGTFRNRMWLEPNASEIIEPGDEIGIGKLKFIYR